MRNDIVQLSDSSNPSVRLLKALMVLNRPSMQMLAGMSGMNASAVKRQLVVLRTQFGCVIPFDRTEKAADGRIGSYQLESTGIFDKRELTRLVRAEAVAAANGAKNV